MRKILGIILVFIMIYLISGCSNVEKSTIGLSIKNKNDIFNKELVTSATNRAYQLDYNLLVVDALNDINTQKGDIEDLIDQKVGCIIIDPIEYEEVKPLVKKALKLGIKIIVISDQEIIDNEIVIVTSNYNFAGQVLGGIAVHEAGSILEILNNDKNTLEISNGFKKTANNKQIIKMFIGANKEDNINNIVEELKNNFDIKLVLTHNVEIWNLWQQALNISGRNDILNLSVGDNDFIKNSIILGKTKALMTGDSEAIGTAVIDIANRWITTGDKKNIEKIDMKLERMRDE